MPRFRRTTLEVDAQRMLQDGIVYTIRGQASYDAGHWLLTTKLCFPDGTVLREQYPVDHERFLLLYEPSDDKAREYLDEMKTLCFGEDDE